MKNLDDFLYKFKNDEKKVPCSFTNTIENFSPKLKESRDLIVKVNAKKNQL